MNKNRMKDLRLIKTREILREAGFFPERFSAKELNEIADDMFKSVSGEKLVSLGAELVFKDGKLTNYRRRGKIRERMREQINSYNSDARMEGITFGQFISANNVIETYGFDVFQWLDDHGITEYNISEGWYIHPRTGEKLEIGVWYD